MSVNPTHKKLILVTGANKGIGLEVARQLTELGHCVLLAARNRQKGEQAVHELKAIHADAHFIHLDVSDENSIIQAAATVKEKFHRLDVLINNAAISLKEDKKISIVDTAVFEEIYRTNVLGPLLMVKHFLPLIPDGGRIINTSSGGGSMTDPVGGWSTAYCISKSSLNALTRHLACELAPRNILVNAYCPGWVRTDMGGKTAPRSVQQGADTAIWLATADVRETGRFFRDREIIPW